MKIYSNGKDRTLTGSFPARFKLLNNGVEVPFIRTGKGSVRLSGDIPFGELDVEEVVKQKTPQPAKLDAQSIAIINKADFDQIDLLNKKLAINQEQMNAHLSALTEHEATLANLETQNAQAIEQTNESMTEMAKVFGKEIQADRERIKATAKSIAQDIAVSSEVLSAKIEAHEKAKNPHKITKETIGLDKVENTSDLDKPVSKATQKALDKKADKSDIEDVRKEIKATEKKQERLVKSIDNANLYGGIGGNELPIGGKTGQILGKKSDKTGDYGWFDNSAKPKWGDIGGNINNQTDLKNALDAKQNVIDDLDTIRAGATSGSTALQPNSPITGATKCKITYDSNGLVTAGSDLEASDIPSLTLSKISDVTASASELNILDGATLTTTELNYVDGVTSSIQTQLNGKQPTGNYVTTDTVQTINQAAIKTFNGRVNFIGEGDANAIYLSTNTRIDVHGTSRTVLGFANGTFLINNSAYPLNLRGSGARPAWNSTSYLALTSDIGNATLTIQKNGVAVDTFNANATSDKTINITVPTNNNELTNGAGYQTAGDVASAISVETTNRENADIGLQQQIDAITASSDVKDIVGTYAQLQAYDTSTLGNNDIIKVLQDETHDNETTYYRWSTTTETFTLIGEEGPYYTKSEADSTFVPQTRTVNNKALSSNITLTASDVGALPDSTVIPTVNDATLTIQKNGTDVATFTANSSTNQTANITVPTDTSDLTNGAGFITGITSGDVTTALGYTPYNSSNPSGYQENVIETIKVNGTAQTVTSKAVDITVPTNNNQLTNGAGYITSSALTGYATETWVGQQGFLTSAALNGYATESWVGQQGYITGITSSDVTTALGYTPYNASNPNGYTSNVGTVTSVNNTSPDGNGNVSLSIPTVNNPTITITQGGVTKGSFTLNQSSGDTIALDAGGGSSLPSQTGNADKFLTTDGTDASWGRVKTNNLFDFKWTDYALNDQNWLRADTFSWQDGTVYSDAYNHLVDDIDGKTATSETIGSYTISYYLADDGHKITTDESTVVNIYNATGVAWYYILDTTNQRFKLPRTKYGFTGLRDAIGKYVEAGLPNITGWFVPAGPTEWATFNANSSHGGCLSTSLVGTNAKNLASTSGTYAASALTINASLSSSIYGNSITVQPPATQMYLYFYVGQFSQSATEQTAGLNAELFNGKVDLNLNNMNPSAASKQTIVGWGIPDYTAGVSKSHNTEYTADKDGFLYVSLTMTSGNSDPYVTISGTSLQIGTTTASTTLRCQGYFFIRKGVKYKVTGGSTNAAKIYFYPCLGG